MIFTTKIMQRNENALQLENPTQRNSFEWVPISTVKIIENHPNGTSTVELDDTIATQIRFTGRPSLVTRVAARSTTAGPHSENVKRLTIGRYTICFNGNEDDYVTLRVTEWDNRPGVKVFAYLFGSDNSKNFRRFANVDENGSIKIWQAFAKDGRQAKAVEALLNMQEVDQIKAGETYALKSSNCCKCGRDLTRAKSIKQGMGEECYAKYASFDELRKQIEAKLPKAVNTVVEMKVRGQWKQI